MKRPSRSYHRVQQSAGQNSKEPEHRSQPLDIATDTENTKESAPITVGCSSLTERARVLRRNRGCTSNDSWTWELIGIFVCVSALVSIFGILRAYDQKPLPHSIAGISLTTAISILATTSRATTLSVAASIIAQQKWLRFVRSHHPLSNVPQYDDATRGPLGSLYLLFTLPRSLIVVATALVTVLALGFEPFVQQSLRFPLHQSPIDSTLPILQASTNVSYGDDISSDKRVTLNALFLQALYSDAVIPLQPFCSASSCQWPSYTTVAVCSSCTDVLNQTTISSNDSSALAEFATGGFMEDFQDMGDIPWGELSMYYYSAPTYYSISLGTGPPIIITANISASMVLDGSLTAALDYPEEVLFDASDRPAPEGDSVPVLVDMTGPMTTLGYVQLARSSDRLQLEARSAKLCSISMCAQEQSSTVLNGSVHINVSDKTWGRYVGDQLEGGEDVAYDWMAQLGSHQFDTVNNSFIYILDELVLNLTDSSNARLHVEWGNYDDQDTPPYDYSYRTINPGPNTMQFLSDPSNSSAKIAQAFTNYLHRNGDTKVTGQAYTTTPFVNVQWRWLCFPLILILICFTTLLITMFQTRRHKLPTWKTSPYPLLFGYQHRDQAVEMVLMAYIDREQAEAGEYGDQERKQLQKTTIPTLVGRDSISNYAKTAHETFVRLRRREGHWVFDRES